RTAATAQVQDAASAGHPIPLSAVFQRHAEAGGEARVWVVNREGTAVSSIPARLGAPPGENEVIVYGLVSGQRIVTAGTARLREDAAVKLLGPSGLGASPVERGPTVVQGAAPAGLLRGRLGWGHGHARGG